MCPRVPGLPLMLHGQTQRGPWLCFCHVICVSRVTYSPLRQAGKLNVSSLTYCSWLEWLIKRNFQRNRSAEQCRLRTLPVRSSVLALRENQNNFGHHIEYSGGSNIMSPNPCFHLRNWGTETWHLWSLQNCCYLSVFNERQTKEKDVRSEGHPRAPVLAGSWTQGDGGFKPQEMFAWGKLCGGGETAPLWAQAQCTRFSGAEWGVGGWCYFWVRKITWK